MSPLAQRGKRLFLALAALIILTQVVSVILTLVGSGGEVRWMKSVIFPLSLAVSFAFLWQGDIWLRRLAGTWGIFTGAFHIYVSSKLYFALLGATPPDSKSVVNETFGFPLGMLGVVGLVYLVVGLLVLFSPSLSAFFRYQREGE